MSHHRILLRETILSAIINGVLSLLFFFLVFGLAKPAAWSALAGDGLPQSFMVALMGSLVPGLIVAAKLGAPRGPVVLRAIAFGIGALVVLGGGGWLWLHDRSGAVAPATALAAKIAYGAVLGALVTPAALALLFRARTAA